MRFRLIDEERSHHAVSLLCRVLGVTRAGYYAWRKREPSARAIQDAALSERIEAIWESSHRTYGAPRVHAELALASGIHISRKRVARLMTELGIQGVSRRKGRRRATSPTAEVAAAPDRVRRQFSADSLDCLWLADITYVPTHEGWLFLAVVIDMCSRKIVGWSMRGDLKAELVTDALRMALARRNPSPGLIHHSDRGGQYRSLLFGRTLRDSGIAASMGSRGDAYDNAATESVIATIKAELVRQKSFKTRDAARLAVFRYIESFYNPHRRHSALGYLSPDEFEEKMREESEATSVA
jgi:putative transposase